MTPGPASAGLAAARSWLFVPATRLDRLGKAFDSGADAVILDLEDAVAPQDKAGARAALAAALPDIRPPVPLVLRINGTDTAWWQQDAAVASHPAFAGLMLPKAESPAQLLQLALLTGGRAVLALVETAAGLAGARALAAAPGVARLAFGSVDFQLDLDIDDDDLALQPFRAELVLASRLARLPPPIDGVTLALGDALRTTADAERARRMGFGGKLCVHPSQVAPTHAAFTPRDADIDWARRVLDAAATAGGAAVAVDGRMVDAPVLQRATRLLARQRPPAG